MKTKYISWRRVSTKRQGESGLGLEAQSRIIEYFTKDGEIVSDYVETHTGKDLIGCVELQKAISHAKSIGAKLIIAKADRFRSLKEALEILDIMGDGNLIMCDVPNADRFTLSLFWMLAEREALLTSIRTKQALKSAQNRGVKLGKPINMTRDAQLNGAKSNLESSMNDANNRKAAAFSKQLKQQGLTLREISEELNNNGFVTSSGGKWHPTSVNRNLNRFSNW